MALACAETPCFWPHGQFALRKMTASVAPSCAKEAVPAHALGTDHCGQRRRGSDSLNGSGRGSENVLSRCRPGRLAVPI